MKMMVLLMVMACCFCLLSQTAEARGTGVVYHLGARLSLIQELPADQQIDGKHVNIGVMYKQFGLFWLPVWNYSEAEYVLIDDAKKHYWKLEPLSAEKKALLSKELGFDFFSKQPTIPLSQKIGLKPLIVLLALYGLWKSFARKKEEEEA